MASVVLEPPLDRISREARPYPAYLLKTGWSGLALFAAAYLGHNDSIHFARNEMRGWCVDTDAEKLAKMRESYPPHWIFVKQDAWEFAALARGSGLMWDVVSVDTFTGDASKRSMETIDLWCSLARHVVTATMGRTDSVMVPQGWRAEHFERSARADWLVLQRD
jgi:hypothetical protein